MNSEEAARLRTALDHAPDTHDTVIWKPNANDELVGVVVTRDQVQSKYDEGTLQEHLLVQDVAGDTWHVYARHAVLAKLIEKHNPQPGDKIAIRRLPDEPGKPYKLYRLVVEPGEDIPF